MRQVVTSPEVCIELNFGQFEKCPQTKDFENSSIL